MIPDVPAVTSSANTLIQKCARYSPALSKASFRRRSPNERHIKWDDGVQRLTLDLSDVNEAEMDLSCRGMEAPVRTPIFRESSIEYNSTYQLIQISLLTHLRILRSRITTYSSRGYFEARSYSRQRHVAYLG